MTNPDPSTLDLSAIRVMCAEEMGWHNIKPYGSEIVGMKPSVLDEFFPLPRVATDANAALLLCDAMDLRTEIRSNRRHPPARNLQGLRHRNQPSTTMTTPTTTPETDCTCNAPFLAPEMHDATCPIRTSIEPTTPETVSDTPEERPLAEVVKYWRAQWNAQTERLDAALTERDAALAELELATIRLENTTLERDAGDKVADRLRSELAASQAREKGLREWASDAFDVIAEGVRLMPLGKLGEWNGVRAVQESFPLDLNASNTAALAAGSE